MDGRFATLSVDIRTLLRKGGFTQSQEVLRLSAMALSRELHVELDTALQIQQELKGGGNAPLMARSATELLRSLSPVRCVTTCCMSLDSLLGGGAPRGAITEVCGAPGAGKTQLCMQLAVASSIPESFGGVGGKTLFLDTEGSFSPSRVFDMAEALTRHLTTQSSTSTLTTSQVMENISIFRAHDSGELLGFVQSLSRLIKLYPVRLVVIDSVALHFRHNFVDISQRNRVLARLAVSLNSVARELDVAVVVTNHMATGEDGELHPALGDTWFHGISNRLVLSKTDQTVFWNHALSGGAGVFPVRRAELVKSSSLDCGQAEFVVVKIGLRQKPREQIEEGQKRIRVG